MVANNSCNKVSEDLLDLIEPRKCDCRSVCQPVILERNGHAATMIQAYNNRFIRADIARFLLDTVLINLPDPFDHSLLEKWLKGLKESLSRAASFEDLKPTNCTVHRMLPNPGIFCSLRCIDTKPALQSDKLRES